MFFCFSLQVVGLIAGTLLVRAWWGWEVAAVFVLGAGVALVNSGLLVWRWYRGLAIHHSDGERHLKAFNRSAKERFLAVGIMLAMGFAWLDLAPLPLLTGFIAGQLAWVIAAAALLTD